MRNVRARKVTRQNRIMGMIDTLLIQIYTYIMLIIRRMFHTHILLASIFEHDLLNYRNFMKDMYPVKINSLEKLHINCEGSNRAKKLTLDTPKKADTDERHAKQKNGFSSATSADTSFNNRTKFSDRKIRRQERYQPTEIGEEADIPKFQYLIAHDVRQQLQKELAQYAHTNIYD